jgi:hypothetical protein
MPAELRLDRARDLADGSSAIDRFLEGRDHHAKAEPAQIAAALRRAVYGIFARDLGKIAPSSSSAHRLASSSGGHEDMRGVVLGLGLALGEFGAKAS